MSYKNRIETVTVSGTALYWDATEGDWSYNADDATLFLVSEDAELDEEFAKASNTAHTPEVSITWS